MSDMKKVSFEEMKGEFIRILRGLGFEDQKAERCGEIFAENTRDGVMSHGLNRFPSFVDFVKRGIIDIHAESKRVNAFGAIEQWDGNRGIGPLNAEQAMNRAIEMAGESGIGCVGLANNNHWMRGGTYGLMAAEANCIGICWTNTIALMPPWGSAEKRIGNNPMVLCIPRKEGPILLDMAMSQFSNGKLEVLRRRGEKLPMVGGYDDKGELTVDPGAILDSKRALPIGFWKGSGLAFALDLMATLIAGGDSTCDISQRPNETGVSQVFMAIRAGALNGDAAVDAKVDSIVEDFLAVSAIESESKIRYPGEGMLAMRKRNMAEGISVDPVLWQSVLEM